MRPIGVGDSPRPDPGHTFTEPFTAHFKIATVADLPYIRLRAVPAIMPIKSAVASTAALTPSIEDDTHGNLRLHAHP